MPAALLPAVWPQAPVHMCWLWCKHYRGVLTDGAVDACLIMLTAMLLVWVLQARAGPVAHQ
jgi:hypothetical protein